MEHLFYTISQAHDADDQLLHKLCRVRHLWQKLSGVVSLDGLPLPTKQPKFALLLLFCRDNDNANEIRDLIEVYECRWKEQSLEQYRPRKEQNKWQRR